MIQFLIGCAVLCIPASPVGSTDDGTLQLDRELDALAKNVPSQSGPETHVGAYLKTSFDYDSETDTRFFNIDRARVNFDATIDKYSARVQVEAAAGSAQILNAYGAWQCNDYLRTTFGRFQTPLYWNTLLEPNRDLFILRTDSGEFWIGGAPGQLSENMGVMLDGAVSKLHWTAAVQNGVDSTADQMAFTGRLRFDVLGAGVGMTEGAYGAPEEAAFSVGAGYFNDQGARDNTNTRVDGDVWAFDAQFTQGLFAANGEYLMYPKNADNLINPASLLNDANPWAVTASYMIVANKYEIAARYHDADDASNSRDITLGVNRYIVGHDVKVQLNVAQVTKDNHSDITRIGVALTVSK